MSTLKNKTDIGGLLGESISVRKINGRVVIKNRPARVQVSTESQDKVKDKFTQSSQWASAQLAKPDVALLYAAGMTPKLKSAYIVAMSDFLNAPEVTSIDTNDYTGDVGDTIVAKATDDFMVTAVSVSITDGTGTVIERGAAVQDAENVYLWKYTATVNNSSLTGTKVSVTASDRPGNKTTLEKLV